MNRLLPLLLLLFPWVSTVPAASVWVEGEAATQKNVQHNGWYESIKKEVLSGGDWLSTYGNTPGSASYDVEVPEAGHYAFWARLNPVASQPQWQLDGGSLTAVDFKDVHEQQNIASDNRPDHRFIAWVKVAEMELTRGKHTIGFTWSGGAANSGGLDCFVLSDDGFVPQGTMKPSAAAVAGGPADWFPLLAGEDPFNPASVIDMSRLIPAPAGQFGFVQAAGKDLHFQKTGAPVKFWGCGANVESGRYSHAQMTQRARLLRKFGVNIVREHPLADEVLVNGQIDAARMDEYDWWFAELKKNGLYSDWSVFYNFTIGPGDGYDPALYAELEGKERKNTYGIITGSPALWEIRTKTLVALLTHRNPYTGMRYVDDPALAIVEMQNEDSIFFWNPLGWLAEGKKMPLHSQQLRERWAAWVKAKYPTDEALQAAWGPLRAGDSVQAKALALMSPWELDGAGPRGTFGGQPKRAGDYIEFLTDLQTSLYTMGEKAMRAAGFQGVSVTTAWQVGGAATDPANIFTDTVGSMIDRHNYFGGGENNDAGIREGAVKNESHLSRPGSGIFTTAMKQVESKPFGMSEWTQSPPNQWKIEAAPLFAYYGMGLQGWDASFHFMQSGTRLGEGWPGMSAYATQTPAYLGQFPALAFAIHRGHIAESGPIAARRLTRADLFTGRDALQQDATKGEYNAKTLQVGGGTPLEAFGIGRITVDFAGGKSEQVDFSKYWDQEKKVIQSATGELTWDYGRQLVTVHTAKTQAVLGRPGTDPIQLPAVSATFKTPFVSVLFTPLDDAPLAVSRRILITAMAQDKQSGTRYSADGQKLEAVGTPPLLLEPVQAKIHFSGAKPASVTPCDPYGVPRPQSAVPVAADGSFTIDGTYRAYYYDVKR